MSELPDVQESLDTREIAIDKVGVRGVEYPIQVLDCSKETQHTVGTFSLTVDLPKQFKGTHMSRFIEVLSAHRHEISVKSIPELLRELRKKLKAETAHLSVRFPYFVEKPAPVTKKVGLMPYACGFDAHMNEDFRITAYVKAPVTTLCPCSKEISARGAHNQRGWATAQVQFKEHVWLEEIIEYIEDSASCGLYPLLKRPDEKWVTERAYDNPRFVEDLVREVAIRFNEDERITGYTIECENEESIHAHNAYARLSRSPK